MVISAAVLAAMAVAVLHLKFDVAHAVTVSFCTLAMAQLWHVFNMREDPARFVLNEITKNVWIWIAIVICLALILMAVYTPLLRGLLELTDPGARGWLLIIIASFIPLVLGPAVQHLAIRTRKD
jgi:Ca2+-transporting ATPase